MKICYSVFPRSFPSELLKNNSSSVKIQLKFTLYCLKDIVQFNSIFLPHKGDGYKALLWIRGSSGVQIFAFIILEDSLVFFESVHESECPVRGGRPYS